jgi:HK97 family phage portal protein
MSLISWWKRKLNLTDPKGWPGSPSRTGRSVTVESALSVSAFWASVRLISQTLGTTSLGFFKRQDDGGREAQQKHPLYRVLHDDPNPDQTAAEFWEGMTASLLVYGNGFARKQLSDGRVIGLDYLSSVPSPNHLRWVVPLRLRLGGSLVYRIQWATGYEDVQPEEIFHVRGFGFGGDVGLPVLTYAREALATAMAAEEVTEQTFREGLRLKGFFTTPDLLTAEQRPRVSWRRV